jgi:hypothetical protein
MGVDYECSFGSSLRCMPSNYPLHLPFASPANINVI